jgi:hypothetical protein
MPSVTSPAAERAAVPARRRRRPLARRILGGLLLAMAVGQVSDLGGFARILDTYRVFPGALPTIAAVALVALEAMAGLALLRGERCGGALSVAVALAWTVLGAQAFARGLPLANCGCFGVHLGQPLRWWVLIEDAEFIALAVWILRAQRRTRSVPPGDPDRDRVEACRPRILAGVGRSTPSA